MLAYFEDAVALAGRGTEDAVARLERRGDPPLEGVGAEVALHDKPRVAALVEARDPLLQQAVQLVLPDPDGRVGPDRPESHVSGNISGQRGVDIGETEGSRVAAHEVKRSLVDVDRPDGCVG